MPIDTAHPQVTAHQSKWERCRDAVGGSDAVKGRKDAYLPRLSGQTDDEYNAYVMRALWYGASARTVQGLTGAVMRKDPAIEAPDVLNDMLRDVTQTGIPIEAFMKTTLDEVLEIGRYGVLVDLPEEAAPVYQPYWVPYRADQIVNWTVRVLKGLPVLTRVVLSETELVPSADDPSKPDHIEQHRELMLMVGPEGTREYQVQLWRKEKDQWVRFEGVKTPTFRTLPLDYIPFCFFGPTSITPDVEKPPILDLVDVNLSHYRSSADLEHGRHFCGLPTPWVAGFPKDTQLRIGSSVAWVSDDPNASAGMLEFTGQGLQALEKALESKERLMAVLGARLLEEQKKAVEAADTIGMRTAGEYSVLRSTATTVSQGFSKLLQWTARWMGVSPEVAKKSTAKLNTDFLDAVLSATEAVQLMQLWQGGAISQETLYFNLQRGELTRPGVTYEKEKAQIEMETPQTVPLDDETDPTEPDMDKAS